jgi:hypothetical protein
LPQTLSSVIWRHYLHPEDKSLSPDGEPCEGYTRGLLLRRSIQAMTPFIYIGKEIERRERKKVKISVFSKTPGLSNITGTKRARLGLPMLGWSSEHDVIHFGSSCVSLRPLNMPLSDFLTANASTPATRARIEQAVEKLELDKRERRLN